MKYKIGTICHSNNFGDFIIIDEIKNYNGKNEKYFKIKFINTGYETISSSRAVRSGRVKDKYIPVVAGVGFVGDFDGKVTSEENVSLYKAWNDMMNRCYNTNDTDYHLYGKLGVMVEERWHCFNNFYNDAKLLPNYNKKILYPNIYQLDKDYLQLHIPKSQRIYSRFTCLWLSKFDNIMIMNRDNDTITGYYGVLYKDGAYCTRINNTIYGRFTIPEAAANLFNYLYPLFKNEFNDVQILNDVIPIPFDNLINYAKNKNIYTSLDLNVGSTTIPEEGVEHKCVRSDRASSFIKWFNEDEDIV